MDVRQTNFTLSMLLNLVGKLDDSPGTDTPRERFRKFLKDNVKDLGTIRDYIEECLRNSDDQYNRAFQDLVNHLGTIMGFDVEFGRYHGVQGEIGFDGLWTSPQGFKIVVEVKKTNVFAIKTATLLNYVNELISEKKIPNWDQALGLYVIGRPEPEISQLEKTIIGEHKADQLRIACVDSILSLAELMNEYDVTHEDVLDVIKPSGPTIDSIVSLIARLVAEKTERPRVEEETAVPTKAREKMQYWLTPVRSDKEGTAEETIKTLVEETGIYAFGERTPGRTQIKPGDWICFYACGKGVVAHSKVASYPENKPHPKTRHPDKYPWTFKVVDAKLYLEKPIAIDASLRAKLDAFKGFDPQRPWAWFVQATRRITENDFMLLTGQTR